MSPIRSLLFVLLALSTVVHADAQAATRSWVEEYRPATADDLRWMDALLRDPAEGDLAPAEWFAAYHQARALRGEDPSASADALARLVAQHPESGAALDAWAWALYEAGRWTEAAVVFARCGEMGWGRVWSAHFNRACALARAGDCEGALGALEEAVATGWERRHQFLEDDDLASLRDDPRFLALAGAPDVTGLDRAAGWAHDLGYLTAEIERLHWYMNHGGDPSAMRDAFTALAHRTAELDDGAMAAHVQRLLASLGDGHSVLYPAPGNVDVGGFLPLELWWFADGLYVTAATDPALEQHVGHEVVSIGGVAARELLARIEPYVSRDNPMGLLFMGPTFLRFGNLLRAIGVLEDDASARIVLRASDGTTETVQVTTGHAALGHGGVGQLPRLGGDRDPLWQRHPERNYWLDWNEATGILYVQYAVVRDMSDESVAQFAARVRATIDDQAPRALVFDLRRNSGGNSFLNPPMIAALNYFESTQPQGALFVLSGRRTFSAAQNLLSEIDQLTGALLVGEPSGSRPNFIGESVTVHLPWSGLIASVSSRFHQSSVPTDHRLWIGPDVPVRLTSEPYFAGEDPVLRAVEALVAASGGR